jgi:hypothetical protein
MIQETALSKQQASRNQHWLVMVTDRELLHLVWAMQAIHEFDILQINDWIDITYWMNIVEHRSHPVNTPDAALIEWRPDTPAVANEYFLREVRQTSRLANLPIIVLCASRLSSVAQTELCERYGIDAVVSKPLPRLFELNQLIAEVRQTVKPSSEKNGGQEEEH